MNARRNETRRVSTARCPLDAGGPATLSATARLKDHDSSTRPDRDVTPALFATPRCSSNTARPIVVSIVCKKAIRHNT
jgi:hypothetical protein